MVHVPAKFRENTSMRFWVTVRKLNVTDRQTDRRTDRRTDGGRCNISRPGPSAPREITRQLISHEQVQKLTPQFLLYIYIGYRFPLSLSTIWGNHLPVILCIWEVNSSVECVQHLPYTHNVKVPVSCPLGPDETEECDHTIKVLNP